MANEPLIAANAAPVRLTAPVTANDAVINVATTLGFASQRGMIQMNRGQGSIISYTGTTATSFTGCVWSQFGSTARDYGTGTLVWKIIPAPGVDVNAGAAFYIYRLSGLNINVANTDIGTFTGLPSQYILRRVTAYLASRLIAVASVSLFTGAGGTGTNLVNAFVLNTLSTTTFLDLTLVAQTTVLTSSSLVLRNVTPTGAAATCSFQIEISPLI